MSKLKGSDLLSSRPASRVAVLVIDIQKGLMDTKPSPYETVDVIHRINFVTGRARAAGAPVVIIQHDGPGDGDWLVPFSDGWKTHPDLNRESSDLLIRKTTGDAFYRTDLEQQLCSRGIESVVLTGYATEFCVDSTLRNTVSKDFEVFVVSDAHTTNDTPDLKALAIRQFFNSVWADSSSERGIHLLSAAEVRFRNSPT